MYKNVERIKIFHIDALLEIGGRFICLPLSIIYLD